MARIAGIDLPRQKRVHVALTYIFGIGPTRAEQVCTALDLNPESRAKELTDEQLGAIASYMESNFAVEGQLRRTNTQSINRLRDIACFRGLRHRRGLPVRGQRTKTNARTRKGPKRTIAGKKKAR